MQSASAPGRRLLPKMAESTVNVLQGVDQFVMKGTSHMEKWKTKIKLVQKIV